MILKHDYGVWCDTCADYVKEFEVIPGCMFINCRGCGDGLIKVTLKDEVIK